MTLTERYSKIPYVDKGRNRYGVDCYGLLYLVYYQERNIDLPLLTSEYNCAIRVSYRNVKRNEGFFADWIEVDKPKKFDVGLFEMNGYLHIMICVDDRGQWGMHISEGSHVKVEKFNSLEFEHTLRGWYQYAGSPNQTASV